MKEHTLLVKAQEAGAPQVSDYELALHEHLLCATVY